MDVVLETLEELKGTQQQLDLHSNWVPIEHRLPPASSSKINLSRSFRYPSILIILFLLSDRLKQINFLEWNPIGKIMRRD